MATGKFGALSRIGSLLAGKGASTLAGATALGGGAVVVNQMTGGGVQDLAGGAAESAIETSSFAGAQNANIDNFAGGNASIQWLVGLLASLADLLGFEEFGDKMRNFRADQQEKLQEEARAAGDTNQMDGTVSAVAPAALAAAGGVGYLALGRAAAPAAAAAAAEAAAGATAPAIAAAAAGAPHARGKFGAAVTLGLGLITAGAITGLTAGEAEAAPAPTPDGTSAPVPASVEAPAQESNSWFYNAFQSAATFATGVVTGVAAIPEDLYDAADHYIAQGYLPGDENQSGTRDAIYSGAEAVGIDIENHQGAAALGELSSIFIPVAGVVGAASKGVRATQVVGAIRSAERVSDGLGLYDAGRAAAQTMSPLIR